MKFTVSNVTQKVASTGKPMWNATLTGEDGASSVINLFDPVTEGQEINGELYVNDKGYTNFKSAQKAAGSNFASAKKEEVITKMQDRKADAIAHAGSITNATHLLTALIEAKVYATSTEAFYKEKLREFIVFYHELYENPGAVAPF